MGLLVEAKRKGGWILQAPIKRPSHGGQRQRPVAPRAAARQGALLGVVACCRESARLQGGMRGPASARLQPLWVSAHVLQDLLPPANARQARQPWGTRSCCRAGTFESARLRWDLRSALRRAQLAKCALARIRGSFLFPRLRLGAVLALRLEHTIGLHIDKRAMQSHRAPTKSALLVKAT